MSPQKTVALGAAVVVLAAAYWFRPWADRAPMRPQTLQELALVHRANVDWPRRLPELDALTAQVQDAIINSGSMIAFVGELDDVRRTPDGTLIRFRCLYDGQDSIYFDLHATPDQLGSFQREMERGQSFAVVGAISRVTRVDFQARPNEDDENDSWSVELVSSTQTFIASGRLVAARRAE